MSVIVPTSVTEVAQDPSPGDTLKRTDGFQALYINTMRDVAERALPIYAISPPVINVDDTTTYTFPTAGAAVTMLGRQASGFWTAVSPTVAATYEIGAFFLDKKSAGTALRYTENSVPYSLGEGRQLYSQRSMNMSGSFTDDTNAVYDGYTYSDRGRIYRQGTGLDSPNDARFSNRTWKPLSYEIVWGRDAAVNYGPWNFSCGDLRTAESYPLTNYAWTMPEPGIPIEVPARAWSVSTINDFRANDESVLQQSYIEFLPDNAANMWTGFTRAHLNYIP